MIKLPRSPADPRPNNRPAYISPLCPQCGANLRLADVLADPSISPENVWHDEWQCPQCRDNIYLDLPGSTG